MINAKFDVVFVSVNVQNNFSEGIRDGDPCLSDVSRTQVSSNNINVVVNNIH